MDSSPRIPDPNLCALVGKLVQPGMLRWRHHKIGLLQAYITEALLPGDGEFRIHVWHPSLILSDEDSGRMHDHRFRLTSTVLLGAMYDTEVKLHDAGNLENDEEAIASFGPLHEVWDIQNARSAEASGEHWVKRSERTPGKYFLEKSNHVYRMGATYSYPPFKFHRSNIEELTVTFCSKREQVNILSARLIARVGSEPKHAFDPTPEHGRVADEHLSLLAEASDRLLFLARSA